MTIARLSQIIKRIDDLPTLPRTVLMITELVNNPRSSARELSRVITDDQVLTARLLRLVNSSFYGFPQRITTVTGAIVLLGFDEIRNLLLTTSLFDLFSTARRKNGVHPEALWDHSLGCAVSAKVIGQYIGYEKVEELFVSGLLHDIGKIVEMVYASKDFSIVEAAVAQRGLLVVKAEEELLGYSHADVGKLLAEQWNLHPKHVEAIACHHVPHTADRFQRETYIVHLADILCRALDLGSGGDNKIPRLHEDSFRVLGLDVNALDPIMDTIDKEFRDIHSFAMHL
ncbi:MAG TPA: HDOD domain-containing protein [Thermodesulfobacteriota bacterium]|nr:HDOD domain-containing protein [Thermodesulfobacteriota bacterium]HNU72292.1 HDOD domain-containing protein [Thermodesulfobacteriota bacterium]